MLGSFDLKSVIVGVLIAYFLLPWIIGKFNSVRRESTA